MSTNDTHDVDFAAVDTEILPPELLLAPNNPLNDKYLRDLASLERLIVSASSCMHFNHIHIIKLRHVGKSTADIADIVDLRPFTINRVIKSEKGQKLLALLAHLALVREGPQIGQRQAMLWRIAERNEEPDPRIAITAVCELNRMHFQQETIAQGGGASGNVVQIVINNDNFPRGALD